jgi:S1-C subfamily serine protease
MIEVIAGVREEETKFGISFCRKTKDSPVILKEVRKEGIFANQGLFPGMVVLEINGQPAQWLRPTEAATILAQSKVGENVSITVEAFTGKVHRAAKSEKWGLTLKNSTKISGIFISGIEEDGLFASTELKSGMKVIRINGKRCPREARDVISVVSKTGDDLEIIGVFANPKTEEQRTEELREKEPELVGTSSEEDDAEPSKLGLNCCGGATTTTSEPGAVEVNTKAYPSIALL